MKRKITFFAITIILCLVIASIIYLRFFKRIDKNDNSSLKSVEFNLPILAWGLSDKRVNMLYPYKGDMSNNIAYDSLNILPEDRKLKLNLSNNEGIVKSISYEIRDFSGELIENTNINEIENKSGNFEFTLPIQNLILDSREYILKVKVDFQTKEDEENIESLYYYSRIRAYDDETFTNMLNLANDFSTRNFDYDKARENTTYLETDGSISAKNLCEVTLKSSFDMLTYNNLKLNLLDEKDIRLLSYNGDVGEVKITSLANRQNNNGETENYEIEEDFVFRKGEERLYILDYHRKMKELFGAKKYNLTGTRLALGIVNEEDISSKISDDKRYIAFSAVRDLFLFDNKENDIKKIYYNDIVDDIAYRYTKYDIKILNVNSEKLDFLVYGYMKEGEQEARLGTAVYTYDILKDKLSKEAFIEDFSSFEELKANIEKLSYLNENKILYLKNAEEIYSINLKTKEIKLDLADIEEGNFATSDNTRYIAYIKDKNLYLKDLDTSEVVEQSFDENSRISIVGFIDSDLIIALSNQNDDFEINSKKREGKKKELRILNNKFELLKNYISQGNYLDNISVDGDIIHFDIFLKEENSIYKFLSSDSIVSSNSRDRKDGIGYYASETKTKMYYIQTPHNYTVARTKISLVKNSSDNNNEFVLSRDNKSRQYFVFGGGSLKSMNIDLSKSIRLAYDNMGYVLYNGQIIYSRAATPISASFDISKDRVNDLISAKDSDKLINIFGVELNQVLYYISRGAKVFTYNSSGEALIIYSYDRYNISVYNINEDRTYKIGRGDAAADFNLSYNDYYTEFDFSK